MQFSESLKKNRDFRFVYERGKSHAVRYFVIYVRKNRRDHNRLGISVSKKVGNSVVRHRITRLIREAYRLQEEQFLCGWDIIVLARPGARDVDYWTVEQSLLKLAEKHKILCNSEGSD